MKTTILFLCAWLFGTLALLPPAEWAPWWLAYPLRGLFLLGAVALCMDLREIANAERERP